jgi:hypothetical protein
VKKSAKAGQRAKGATRTPAARAAKKTAKKAARRRTAVRAAGSRAAKRAKTARKRPAPQPGSRVAAAARKVRGTVAATVQAVVGSRPWSADENDPIALLETDHRRFRELIKKGEGTTERAIKSRTALLDALTRELTIHELIEEQVLYRALKPHADVRDIVLEGVEEHHVADLVVKELQDLAKDDEQWGAKFKVLGESIEHHLEEEEGQMFPKARKVLTREELQALGARMRAMKAEAERG